MKKKVNKKNRNVNSKITILFIAIWFFLFIFINIAFAGYTNIVDVEGIASMEGHLFDYVYISNVSIKESNNGSSINYAFLDHELKANIIATSCGDSITYEATIVNTTPYKAYITQATLSSNISGVGTTSSTINATFPGLVLNDTYVDPHSTKKVLIKLENNCTGTDESNLIKINFDYSLYKYFDLTINSTPNDANVSLTTAEGTFTGTGSVTHRVYEGETVTYSASKKYYYTANGTYTMTAADHTENLVLNPDPHRELTITATPNTSTIVVNKGGSVVATGTGSVTATVEVGDEVTYTVDEPEYYYTQDGDNYYGYSETLTMPNVDDSRSVTLSERPWIDGRAVNSNRTTAATRKVTNWHAGYYLVELWGGKGGDSTGSGGTAGYIYGVVYVPYGSYVYSTAGGNGAGTSGAAGGANGGGAGTSASAQNSRGASGGGYSAFSVEADTISLANVNSGSVKLIAGGSGGGSGRGAALLTGSSENGGNGGSLTSTKSTITTGHVFAGTAGGTAGDTGIGGGGTTSAGTNSATTSSNGSALKGGNGADRGGGGGAGYYGGAGGSGTGAAFVGYGPGGGGGGSSFIATGVTYSGLSNSVTSKLVGTNPSSTGGAVIVTYIGKNL